MRKLLGITIILLLLPATALAQTRAERVAAWHARIHARTVYRETHQKKLLTAPPAGGPIFALHGEPRHTEPGYPCIEPDKFETCAEQHAHRMFELRFEVRHEEAWSVGVCPLGERVSQPFPRVVGTPAAERLTISEHGNIEEYSVLGGAPLKELYSLVGVNLEVECENRLGSEDVLLESTRKTEGRGGVIECTSGGGCREE